MDLVIVESPAKAKTIGHYLGAGYEVVASVGHVIDLPQDKLGVDTANGFKPTFTVIPGKQGVIDNLKKRAKAADTVYLAPDPDREGEAIAWHIAEQIKNKNSRIKRVLFNEITKKGVTEGISHPGEINENRVKAQVSRRILDRLVGYQVSPLLWRPLKYGLSAGRVQSVALRLICEREREIETFKPVESWTIEADFKIIGKDESESGVLHAKCDKISGKKANIKNEKEADKILNNMPSSFIVASVEKKAVKQSPAFPFTTSALQQEAIRRLNFTAKKTMSVAQSLYEGAELGEEGLTGLITYMRTDSVRISPEAAAAASEYILDKYGKDYLPQKKRTKKSGGANVQDAHEAIRPTGIMRTPKDVKKYVTPDQYKLYKLIWERFIASQMADAVFDQTSVTIEGGELSFRSTGRVLKFPGFSVLYSASEEKGGGENTPIHFNVKEGSRAECLKTEKSQHFTQAPARYTEASLVKTLEQEGIGRPSTYVSIISTIVERKYTEIKEKKFRPTELGRIVNELLITNFPKIFEVHFTAEMEKELDLIEEGRENWDEVLTDFYKDFDSELKKASSGKLASGLKTDITCPECKKGKLILKYGKNGAFAACENYPECSFTSDFKREETGKITLTEGNEAKNSGIKCEKCGRELVIKRGRFGEMLGCSGYPECKNIKNFCYLPDGSIKVISEDGLKSKCPKCEGALTIKSGRNGMFAACKNYPECKYTANIKISDEGVIEVLEKKEGTGEICEKCGKPMVMRWGPKGPFLACSGYPECKNAKSLRKAAKK